MSVTERLLYSGLTAEERVTEAVRLAGLEGCHYGGVGKIRWGPISCLVVLLHLPRGVARVELREKASMEELLWTIGKAVIAQAVETVARTDLTDEQRDRVMAFSDELEQRLVSLGVATEERR